MYCYDGFTVKTEPDYREMIAKEREIEEVYCEVYDEKDIAMQRCLMDFNMMPNFEYEENSVDSIENGIKNIIDGNISFLELRKKEQLFNRQSELFYRAIDVLKTLAGDDIRRTLSDALCMTEDEIEDALSGPEQKEGINLM